MNALHKRENNIERYFVASYVTRKNVVFSEKQIKSICFSEFLLSFPKLRSNQACKYKEYNKPRVGYKVYWLNYVLKE